GARRLPRRRGGSRRPPHPPAAPPRGRVALAMRLRSKRARRALTTATTEGWVQPFRLAGGEAARPTVTTIGNLDSPLGATVDARGLVTPGGAWSLDWWVGADDRWHVPSREVAVRQKLLADSPVVESAMRVPSGDVVQRAYA